MKYEWKLILSLKNLIWTYKLNREILKPETINHFLHPQLKILYLVHIFSLVNAIA